MKLVRIFEKYRMECTGKSQLPREDGTMRLLVKVDFPTLVYGAITIPAGKREMCFEYDAELCKFVEVSNGIAGGYLQYEDENGDLFDLDANGNQLTG